ncbi:MAG TPA: RDD family protein [Vicinamibacterales bacterium]|nr:RDD family protein [Vicinamibacterales bacterium]
MRCPKCHYLSFDPEPRCKNCGYDLEVADADLAMRTAEPADGAIPDLTLHDSVAPAIAPVTLEIRPVETEQESEPQWEPEPEPDWDPMIEPAAHSPRLSLVDPEPAARPAAATRTAAAVAEPPARMFPPPIESSPKPLEAVARKSEEPPATRTPFRSPHTTADLPLFVKSVADSESLPDEDLLRSGGPLPLPPARPPLSVRRSAPEAPRPKPAQPARRVGPLDHDLLEDLQRVEREEAVHRIAAASAANAAYRDAAEQVDPAQRAAAAGIDVAVLGGIAAFVVWATLRLCNISLSGLGAGALVPLLFFLTLIDLGYLLMFTAAGGQTIGKMIMSIRVESADPQADLSLRRSAWRSVLTMVSVIGLGLGWLPALLGRGTLHDRLARTRVVRA